MTTKLNKLGVNTHKYRRVTNMLINNKLVCPCCLVAKTQWHVHHFIPVMDGGRDIKQNLVVICSICHRTIHEGEPDQAMLAWETLRNFMWSKYGLVNISRTVLKALLDGEQFSSFDPCKLSSWRSIHNEIKMKTGKLYKEFMKSKGYQYAN